MANKQINLYQQKLDGQPFQYDEHNQGRFDAFEAQALSGCYQVHYKRDIPPKTNKQVKTIFGLLISHTIEEVNDMGLDTSGFLKLLLQEDLPSGVPLRKDTLYALLIDLCPVYNENHEKLTLSKMNIAQAGQFFNDCRDLLASRGIYISDPSPTWKEEKRRIK